MNLKTLPFVLAVSAVLSANCTSQSTTATEELDKEAPLLERDADGDFIVDTEVLADIDLGHGRLVYEIATNGPNRGELTMMETSNPDKDGNVRIPEQTRSLLERYLLATTSTTPIPAAIVAAEANEELLERSLGRAIVDKMPETIIGAPSEGPVLSSATNAQMCAEGTTSGSFASQVCSTNSSANQKHCHNGTWYSVTDDTHGFKVWSVRSLTLACYANARVKHRYKFGFWYTTKDRSIGSGSLAQHTTDGSISARRRDIRHWRTASGFVRGASFFW